MSRPTIYNRKLVARALALVALTSLVALAGHSGGRPALFDGGNRVNASKPAGQAVSSLASTKPDRATQARLSEVYGNVPLHFTGKRGPLDAATLATPGHVSRPQTLAGRRPSPAADKAAQRLAGKTASAGIQESIRVLKQRGEYESLRAAVEKSRYRLQEQKSADVSGSASGYIASNHAQDIRTEFTKSGVHVEPRSADQPAWRWQLRLTGYGFGERLQPLSKTEMSCADNRMEYRYSVTPPLREEGKTHSTPLSGGNGGERVALTEWYVNDARGIEHGFTLSSPPAGSRKGRARAAIPVSGRTTHLPSRTVRREPQAPDTEFLHLTLKVSGNLQGEMVEQGTAIQFVSADGTPVLGYRDLHAYDSRGRALPARLALKGERLSLIVDDRLAVYPVTIDPIIFSTTKLTASDGAAGDDFGGSVSMDGDTVVVGAPGDDTAAGGNAGSAYVFVRSGTSWVEQAKLTASDGAPLDSFGGSVSVDGDTVVVGAHGDNSEYDPLLLFFGSAYVFVRSGTIWSQQAKLRASDGFIDDFFGISVSVDGDTVVVGAFGDSDEHLHAGSAYVFVRSGTSWSEQAKLTAIDGATFDEFGWSVSVDGDTAVVGAPHFNAIPPGPVFGSAYVFVRTGTSWSGQAKLTAGADAAKDDRFGNSVSVDGDTAVVGAFRDDTAAGVDAGSAYVFVRSGTNWIRQAKLTASDAAAFDFFGYSVSVDGNFIVVGKPVGSGASGPEAAYVYMRSDSFYSQVAKLQPPPRLSPVSDFGWSVDVTPYGRVVRVVVGSLGGAGSAWVFDFGLLSYIIAIEDDIAGLYRQGVLNAGQADAFIAKLEAVVEALDRDDAGAALTQFRAFINQVEAYINARILSPAQGRMLIDQANDIIGLVGG